MKKPIPLFDICSIDQSVHPDLLAERFGEYLAKHYAHLSHPHRHSFYHLVMFTKGKGTHTIDFQEFAVQPYQMYFMVPGQVHSWHFEGEVDGYIVNFNDGLFSSFLHKHDYIHQYVFFQGNSKDSVVNLTGDSRQTIQQLFESMLGESIDMIRLLLLQLFIQVQRCCTASASANVPENKLVLVNQFRQLVDKNFRSKKLPKDYAELMYITPNYLNALCKDALGVTAGDIIRDRILLEAKRSLINPSVDVAEVAYDLNFQDNSYFTRFFKKSTGLTPEQFRKQLLNKHN